MDNLTVKYYLDLAACLNFSKAAAMNDMTQSSFSKCIMRLEKEVGLPLVDRSQRPIALTPAGACLENHFQKIYAEYQAAMGDMEAFKYPVPDTIRVLICPRSYAIKNAFADFMEQHTDIALAYGQTSDIDSVVDTMLREKYDFAISSKPVLVPPQIRTTRLYGDRLFLVASVENPLSQKEAASFSDLNGQTIVYSPFSTSLTKMLQKYFDFDVSYMPEDTNYEASHRELAFYNIARNHGVGLFLGRDITLFAPANTVYIPIRELDEMPVVLMERISAPEIPAKKIFREWIEQNLEGYVCSSVRPSADM